jgi:hypothetical protein
MIADVKARRMRWAAHVARIREKRNGYRLQVGKSERKRPLGRPRHRWVDNIRMDLGEVGWGDVHDQILVSYLTIAGCLIRGAHSLGTHVLGAE